MVVTPRLRSWGRGRASAARDSAQHRGLKNDPYSDTSAVFPVDCRSKAVPIRCHRPVACQSR